MSTASYEQVALDGLAWPVEVRSHPQARRLRLSLDAPRGLLRLTVPRRVSRRAALDWACQQAAWVAGQVAGVAPAEPLVSGASIPFDGTKLTLRWDPAAPRTPRLDDGELLCGGPEDRFGDRVARWLRSEARRRLVAETGRLVTATDMPGGPVSVGDADTRWGSCSSSGAIRYNWRLLLAPPHVRAYVVAHEVAHRVHMNHGPDFHALQDQLYNGDVAVARADLRRLGPRLKRVGRG